MKQFIIKKTKNKGLGLFTLKNIKKGQHLFHQNLNKLKKYSLKQIEKLKNIDTDHADYIGNKKYVIDFSLPSYMNHSCNPNCYLKMKTIAIKDIYSLRDIKKGEELTHDYTATSIDQFNGKGFWREKCKCKSKNCRKILHGDLFKLPKKLQVNYYFNLPLSIKRKYKKHFNKFFKNRKPFKRIIN